jgi:hypothetical protein
MATSKSKLLDNLQRRLALLREEEPLHPPLNVEWVVPDIALQPGQSFDLKATIPLNVTPVGFSVASGSLPPGVSLSPDGVLRVSANAQPASTTGVRFYCFV